MESETRRNIMTRRLKIWLMLIAIAFADALVLFSVMYFVPSNSPFYTPLYYVVDGLTTAAVLIAFQTIRTRAGYGKYKKITPSGGGTFSLLLADESPEDYKQRVREASDMYIQGKINSEDQFFSIIGQRTEKEEKIFSALKKIKEEIGKI